MLRVLADTSVWVAHFRKTERRLTKLLNESRVLMHACVLGELACGNFKNRAATFKDLRSLPWAIEATDEEVLSLS
ncbi:MAG: VapC toxin family PIN domain ribonuclease, partial [Bryobacteraceae bacterium]